MPAQYYAQFCDITIHTVGPFDSTSACDAHAEYCSWFGDSTDYLGAYIEDGVLPEDLEEVVSPEDDIATIRAVIG